MKIKQSFVTNSSSSSFIVAWDRKLSEYDFEYVKEKITPLEKATVVFKDSIKQEGVLISKELRPKCVACQLIERMEDSYYWDTPDKDELIAWLKENIGKYIYHYHYSDEDGEFWGNMEHGGTFDVLPHLRISHH